MSFVNIVYFVHGTTTDNEKHIATGWAPGELSELGKKQSEELKKILEGKQFDVIFSSDLKRAIETVDIAFGDRIPVIIDDRLRECNYGDLNEAGSEKIDSMVLNCIDTPFPNGESYKDVERRMRNLLRDLIFSYSGKTIVLVSHRAPQLALDVIVNGKTWKEAFRDDWRNKEPKEWKPGWNYTFQPK